MQRIWSADIANQCGMRGMATSIVPCLEEVSDGFMDDSAMIEIRKGTNFFTVMHASTLTMQPSPLVGIAPQEED